MTRAPCVSLFFTCIECSETRAHRLLALVACFPSQKSLRHYLQERGRMMRSGEEACAARAFNVHPYGNIGKGR